MRKRALFNTKLDLHFYDWFFFFLFYDDNIGVCLYQSAYKICFESVPKSPKMYDHTGFWAFHLFHWIPTALCKCLLLPFHLLIIIFYLQNKAALYSNYLLKWNPCGEEMWSNAVELVKEMGLKHYTVYMCVWLMFMCVFPAAKSRGCNVSAIKACCCGWRTQALLPAVTGIRRGF